VSSGSQCYFSGVLKRNYQSEMEKNYSSLKISSYLYNLTSRIPCCRLLKVSQRHTHISCTI